MTDKIVVDGAIAEGLHDIADAIRELATEIRHASERIGVNGTPDMKTPGALEFIGMQLRDGIKVNINTED
jgi:hypothetical protein